MTKSISPNWRRIAMFAMLLMALLLMFPSPARLSASLPQIGADARPKPTPAPKKSTPPKNNAPARTTRRSSTRTNSGTTTRAPRAGTLIRNQIGMEFVYVPAGTFIMGSENGRDNEKPVHRVTISNSFYMGRYEVTQAQWQQVMGSNPSTFNSGPPENLKERMEALQNEAERTEREYKRAVDLLQAGVVSREEFDSARDRRNNASALLEAARHGDTLPVETVSWDGVTEFIRQLNARRDGYTYRLPSEAEWEYACRAGGTADNVGDLDSIAWYQNNSGGRTHPVGQKQPNAWGLYDMYGNVWELCDDGGHDNYNGAPQDGSAWVSGGCNICREMRGGNFFNDANILRPTFREYITTGHSVSDIGFRVVAVGRT